MLTSNGAKPEKPKRLSIAIHDSRGSRWIKRIGAALALTGSPIFLGYAMGSAPLQWLGFVFGIILLIAFVQKDTPTFDSVDGAIEYLKNLPKE